jgi:hypothetical protein
MGSGASTEEKYASQQLAKHCPHIKHELNTRFKIQSRINMYPVYNLQFVYNLDDSCDYQPTMYWVHRPLTSNMTSGQHKKIEKLNEEYAWAWENFEWYYASY